MRWVIRICFRGGQPQHAKETPSGVRNSKLSALPTKLRFGEKPRLDPFEAPPRERFRKDLQSSTTAEGVETYKR